MSYTEINPIIKQILLEKTTGSLFIDSFDRVWDLEDLFRHFDAEIVDAELISSLDKLLHEIKIGEWHIDNILTALITILR